MNREHFDALRLRLLSQSNHSAGRIKLIDLQGLKKGISFGLGIILTLGASALLAVAVTGTMNTYVTGAVMDASSLNTNFSTLKTAIESIPNWKSNGTSAYYTDGNVGMGITSPSVPLHIQSTLSSSASAPYSSGLTIEADGAANIGRMGIVSYGAGTPTLQFFNALNSKASPSALISTSRIGGFNFTGYNGSAWATAAQILANTSENWSSSAQGSHLQFITTPNGTTVAVEAMRMENNGHIGISVISPAYRLDVSNTSAAITMRLTGSGGACTHAPTAGSETVACSSDEKLKKNIRDSKPALDELLKFQIKDYEIKSTGASATGVIAQEVQKTFPELVHKDEKGILLVEQVNPWKMLKAIQELKSLYDHEKSLSSDLSLRMSRLTDENARKDALNASLTERLGRLERENSRMTALEARLRAIETMQTAGKR